jgi:hypothetical protein
MDIAGHVSRQMLARYSHIRMEAKRKALEAHREQDSARATGPAAQCPTEPPCQTTRTVRNPKVSGGGLYRLFHPPLRNEASNLLFPVFL